MVAPTVRADLRAGAKAVLFFVGIVVTCIGAAALSTIQARRARPEVDSSTTS